MKHDKAEYRLVRIERVLVMQAATITTLQRAITRLVVAAGPQVSALVTADVIEGIESHIEKMKADDSTLDGILRKQQRVLNDFATGLKSSLGDLAEALNDTKREAPET
mgnify:CR=1 FL=1